MNSGVWKRNNENRIGCNILFSAHPWCNLPSEIKCKIEIFSDDLVCVICNIVMTEKTGYHPPHVNTFYGQTNLMLMYENEYFDDGK